MFHKAGDVWEQALLGMGTLVVPGVRRQSISLQAEIANQAEPERKLCWPMLWLKELLVLVLSPTSLSFAKCVNILYITFQTC